MTSPSDIAAPPRAGLILFAVYVLIYGGFVACAVIDRRILATTWVGVPLSVWWGLLLIVAPMPLSAAYLWLMRDNTETEARHET